MLRLENVKELSHQVAEQHNKKGYALVKITSDPWPSGHVLVNVTKNPLVVDGASLKAKADIRKWLWDESRAFRAALRRKKRTWIWSRVAGEDTLVGFATAVRKNVAERMVQRNADYQWIEVSP
jgi:hypothetical protein